MKALKVICAAAVLAVSLSTTTYAEGADPGIIQHPGLTSSVAEDVNQPPSGDIGSPGVTSTEPGDIGSSAFMDTLWLMISIF
jgi:hypothetical protein